MVSELINTGSELLLGRVLNTHQQWLGQQLANLGCPVRRQVTVPDDAAAIRSAVMDALQRADVVITTGGLGPTSDDRTREWVAEALGRELQHNEEVARRIRSYFESRGRSVPTGTRVEAMVPEGAVVLNNEFGTAPGLALRVDRTLSNNAQHIPDSGISQSAILILLPGPPRELRPMFLNQALPWIRSVLIGIEPFVCRTLRTAGLGESLVEERVIEPLRELLLTGVELGFCARLGEVDIRLTASGNDAERRIVEGLGCIRTLLRDHIFGEEDDTLESSVIRDLTNLNKSVAVAESCTGGLLAHRLTNVPGASKVFHGGWVTYSNASKSAWLGVSPESLEHHGAVSEPVAVQMAKGARKVAGTDYGVAITGIAGPSGGTTDKPVGTVYVCVASSSEVRVHRYLNAFDRETFKTVTTQNALILLRDILQRGLDLP